MPKQDDLFALVKVLTPREKAYFKRFAKRADEGGKQQYLQLFEAMDRMAVYDGPALRKKLAGSINIKRFSAEKAYLYNQILRALDQFSLRKHQGRQVEALRREAELLAERGLLEAAHKRLDKALMMVEATEDFGRHLVLLRLLIRIYELEAKGQVTERIRAINAKRDDIRRKQSNLDAYHALRFEVFDVQHKYGQVSKGQTCPELDALLAHPLLQHPDAALSLRARERFYYCVNLMRCIQKQYGQWYTGYGEYVGFMEKHSSVFMRSNFLQLYNNHLYACLVVQDHAEFWRSETKLRKLLNDGDPNHRCMLESRILSFYVETGQFDKGIAHFHRLPWEEERLFERADAFWQLSLYRAMMRLLLLSKKWELAIDINRYRPTGNIMQRLGNTYLVDDLQVLLAHIELKNIQVVESMLRSIYRHLQKANSLGPFQRTVLAFLRSLSLDSPMPELRQKMQDLLDEMDQLAADPERNLFVHFFPFPAWLRHRLNPDTDLERLVHETYKAFHGVENVEA